MRTVDALDALWRARLRDDRVCLSVSEWADTYRILPANASANPGPWRTDAAPYLRGVMDALSVNHPCWKCVFVKSNQIGGSETFNNLLGYRIHQFPCPILLVVPRDKDVAKYVNTRVEPMIEATPALAARIGRSELGEEASNNQVIKRFPGGQLLISGSGTAAVFRSDPIEVAILDDLDACARNNPEGDIVELAEKRTNTFSDRPRKVVLISTPTIKDNSPIEREYAWSSQNRYHVPCPACGAFQLLAWERLIWTDETAQDPRYRCESCAAELPETEKPGMLRRGIWRPERPELSGQVEGFHINALYSPWRKWSEIVHSFRAAKALLDAEHDHSKMQVFVNCDLGKSFVLPEQVRLQGVELEVYKRREPPFDARTLPLALVTIGADVQANRLEATVYGWGAGLECWVLEHRVIKGAIEEHGVWDELRQLATGCHARAMCVDAGAYTQTVKDQVQRLLLPLLGQKCALWAIKGITGRGAIWPRATRPGELVTICIDAAKDQIFGALERVAEPGPGFVHIPTACGEPWLNQLFSERPATVKDRTRARYVKMEGRRRNEALDCAVYARAALYALIALDPGLGRKLLHGDQARARQLQSAHLPVAPRQRVPRPRGRGRRRSWVNG